MTNALVYRSMVPPLPSCLVPPDGNGSASAQRGHSPGRYDPPAASASPQSACGKLSPLFYAFALAGRMVSRSVTVVSSPTRKKTPAVIVTPIHSRMYDCAVMYPIPSTRST